MEEPLGGNVPQVENICSKKHMTKKVIKYLNK